MKKNLPVTLLEKVLIIAMVIIAAAIVLWVVSPWVLAFFAPIKAAALPAPFDTLSLSSVALGIFAACVVLSVPTAYRRLCNDLAQTRALVINHD